jgi:hypothetical protein
VPGEFFGNFSGDDLFAAASRNPLCRLKWVGIALVEVVVGQFIGFTSGCYWFYSTGELTSEGWNKYIGGIDTACKMAPRITTALVISYQSGSPNSQQRVLVKEVCEANIEALKKLSGHAFVSDSGLVRGALTAVNWIFRKPFPEKVFSAPPGAFVWLESVAPEFNAEMVWREIVKVVPARDLWPNVELPGVRRVA